MVLETERLMLRPWKKEDEGGLYLLAQDERVGLPCGWAPHKNQQESREVLQDILMNDYTFAIVDKDEQKLIGNISLMPYCESRFAQNDRQAEIGFWLGYPYWNKGYMTEGCKKLIEYGLKEIGLEAIWCAHNLENYGSMRVQQKCGFVFHHEDAYYSRELNKEIKVMVNCIKNTKICEIYRQTAKKNLE